ncbi:hypothetical protein BJY52DRAFT_1189175 [Lactarius psammicola]|nr:hypothetical protein BJY52DRAFT_1189175 [Lactarius psammicola]
MSPPRQSHESPLPLHNPAAATGYPPLPLPMPHHQGFPPPTPPPGYPSPMPPHPGIHGMLYPSPHSMLPFPSALHGYNNQLPTWPGYAPYYHAPAPIPPPTPPHTGNSAGPAHPTPVVPPKGPDVQQKKYLNVQRGPNDWEFEVSVVSNSAKRSFTGHMAMSWRKFEEEALRKLDDDAPLPAQWAYKLSADVGKMSHLSNEREWDSAMTRLRAKVKTACTRAVGVEVKNITKPPSKASKGKEKRRREDDIPGSVSSDQSLLGPFKKLEAALWCQMHGAHCLVEHSGGQNTHRRLTHEGMTLWAKKISLGQATIYNPPHSLNFNRLPMKKSRLSHKTPPEVHVAVNFASPHPGTEVPYTLSSTTHQVNQQPSSSHGTPSKSEGTSDDTHFDVSSPQVMDLTVCLLLELMDRDDPDPDLQYGDLEGELGEAGISGVVDLYRLPEGLLATFGKLGLERARRLHACVEERLMPLMLPGRRDVEKGGVAGGSGRRAEATTKKSVMKRQSREVIVVWSSPEPSANVKDDIVDVEDEDEDELPSIEVL